MARIGNVESCCFGSGSYLYQGLRADSLEFLWLFPYGHKMIVASLSIQFPIPHRKGEAEAGVMLRVSPQYLLLLYLTAPALVCDMWNRVSQPWVERLHWRWGLSHWTTGEVPSHHLLFIRDEKVFLPSRLHHRDKRKPLRIMIQADNRLLPR